MTNLGREGCEGLSLHIIRSIKQKSGNGVSELSNIGNICSNIRQSIQGTRCFYKSFKKLEFCVSSFAIVIGIRDRISFFKGYNLISGLLFLRNDVILKTIPI